MMSAREHVALYVACIRIGPAASYPRATASTPGDVSDPPWQQIRCDHDAENIRGLSESVGLLALVVLAIVIGIHAFLAGVGLYDAPGSKFGLGET